MAKLIKQRSDSIDIRGLLDADTPTGLPLSGIYKKSFGYYTIKDRLPVILTKVIDTLSQGKEEIAKKYGEEAKEDVKYITGCISKLKSELVTNKPLLEFESLPDDVADVNKWNEVLAERAKIENEPPTWFKTIWLFCECYMYRRICQDICTTKLLKTYDPFEKQKCDAFRNSIGSINSLSEFVMNVIGERSKNLSVDEMKNEFINLVKLNLWGNKCDLSLSNGADVSQSGDPVGMLKDLEKDLLVDDSNAIWEAIKSSSSGSVDIVLDNAGYEFMTDLCLAAFITHFKLADKVRFYVKRIPWFISDVTTPDFHWTIEEIKKADNKHLAALGRLCDSCLKNGTWSIEEESFWTEPYDFAQMKLKDPKLYKKLSEAKIAIFKGDLNYRKLLGDINWEHTTTFSESLRGFQPTTIASLRTLKCDIVVGMAPGQDIKVQEQEPNWMICGKFGTIQVA